MRFSQPTTARQINRLRVLNFIALNEGLSRADVSRKLGLNKVSTSEIVDVLVTEEIVIETGTRTTAAGRPPITLELQKDFKMVLAIDVGTRNTSVALVNLVGDMLRFERFPTAKNPQPEQMAATIIQATNKFLARMKDPKAVCGMVVSVNGVVEPATGTILRASQWNWESVPLAYALSKHIPFPVIVENNVKAMVLGERWFANISEETSYFYVNWGEHIGAAWLSAGKIMDQDCQFGHIPLTTTGLCRCGATGCLETLAAGWALIESVPGASSVKQLCTMAESSAPIKKKLELAMQSMAQGLIFASAILRPQKIIMGGGVSALPEQYFEILQNTFQTKSSPLIRESTSIERTNLGERAGILGTAAIGLDQFLFKRSLLEQLKQYQGK